MDWQILVALAVPVLGFLGALVSKDREPGAYRRLKHASEALASAPERTKARDALDQLVAVQAEGLRNKESARAARSLNPTNLILSIVLAVGGAFAGYWLWAWVQTTAQTPWVWLSVPVTGVVGLAIAVIIGAAFGTIFKAPSSR